MYDGITLDGVKYNVRIVYGSIKRTFAIIEGDQGGESITDALIRDVIGTKYSYTMTVEPVPSDLASYNLFYEAISKPQSTHTVIMPYGDTTLQFTCCVYGGTDSDTGIFAGHRKWGGLTVAFSPQSPQVLSTE